MTGFQEILAYSCSGILPAGQSCNVQALANATKDRMDWDGPESSGFKSDRLCQRIQDGQNVSKCEDVDMGCIAYI